MKFLKFLFSWITPRNRVSKALKEDLSLLKKVDFQNTDSKIEMAELENYSKLQTEKYKALAKCKGCEEEVFVLKVNGGEEGYYSSIRQLAIKNDLNPRSVNNYWRNCNGNPTKNFKEIYEIINYKDLKNENNNI